ncbi:MAG TPA: copper chaperone PCu(A)C [Rhodanobacteraceae bacterium]|nr:copper chaperone PCu(A)C [Rhodanobacteraceae bacterium]
MRKLTLVAVLLALGFTAHAATSAKPQVHVSHAWIRVLPGALPAGGYATISNTGDAPLTLTGASSPAYANVMLHKSSMRNGMSHMRMVKQLKLPAHATVKFAPGGYHLMLMQATHKVSPGDTVPVTLHFADGSQLKVDFTARPANAH